MAVAVADAQAAFGETVTITPSGSNRKLFSGLADDAVGNQATVPACTFASGAGFTEIAETDDAASYYLAVMQDSEEPAASGGTLDISGTDIVITSVTGIALSGVDRAGGVESVQESEGNVASLSVTVVSGSTDDLVVGFFAVNNVGAPPWFTASGDTPTIRTHLGDTSHGAACVTCPGAAGNVNIGGSWTGSQRAALIAFNVPAAGGSADPEGSLIGGKLLRGGLLIHGVLGR